MKIRLLREEFMNADIQINRRHDEAHSSFSRLTIKHITRCRDMIVGFEKEIPQREVSALHRRKSAVNKNYRTGLSQTCRKSRLLMRS